MLSRWSLIWAALFSVLVPEAASALIVDGASFSEEAWPDLPINRVTGMAWAPDGSKRLFFTDQRGTVRIVKYGPPVAVVATPFATMSPLHDDGECGLIGLAFDPNFQVNHYVYFFVTVANDEQQIIRYTANGDVGENRTVLVEDLPTTGGNHDGGAIGIGPDGKLYWAVGDNTVDEGIDGDLQSLGSKVGRANIDGSVPNDNPFFDGGGSNNDYIWARGFRNPFTMTFHPESGALWLNVVGEGHEQAFVVSRGSHGGFDDYENNQPGGYLSPIIAYRTNGTNTRTIGASGAVRSGGVVTFTTSNEHRFRRGERITVSGVGNASFNGDVFVASTPSDTTFTAQQAGADATSGGGSAQTQNLGGCITGGTFYAGTQFAADYRGDYFFGDCNSGRIMRAAMSSATAIERIEPFATDHDNYIDIETGPDGALYYVTLGGALYRTTFKHTSQGLVVSKTNVWMSEGGQHSIGVSLATAPAADVVVSVARSGGDSDITVSAGGSLTFTSSNWNVPQTVTISSAADGDTSLDIATLGVSSSGLTSESVTVNAIENGGNALVVSTSALEVAEGGSGTFTVALATAPAADVTVTVARTGDSDITVSGGATLTFTPANFDDAQTVTIAAAQDPDNADDSARIAISATGFAARSVAVTGSDDDEAAPQITSTARTTAVLNTPYAYTVVATGRPAPSFALTSAPAGMTIGSSSGAIAWTPTAAGAFDVVVRASNGVAPDATQSFTITVAADAPPICALTKPEANDVVSGNEVEFFGDGDDDVGTTKAEFFVDGQLGYTDVGTSGHYHWQSDHAVWDTTRYSDGAHQVKIKVTDTMGQSCEVEVSVTVANNGTPPADAGTPPNDAGTAGASGGSSGGSGGTTSGGGAASGGSGAMSGAGGGTQAGNGGRGGGGGSSARPGGGAGSSAAGNQANEGGSGASASADLQGGCSCRIGASERPRSALPLTALLVLALALRRRRVARS